jgi:hypothetical protein
VWSSCEEPDHGRIDCSPVRVLRKNVEIATSFLKLNVEYLHLLIELDLKSGYEIVADDFKKTLTCCFFSHIFLFTCIKIWFTFHNSILAEKEDEQRIKRMRKNRG